MKKVWLALTIIFTSVDFCLADKEIEIDKSQHQLKIIENGKVLHAYSCALGKGKNGKKEKAGDNFTPEGEYQIIAINKISGFHWFLHLSYPNMADIENGHKKGILSDSVYNSMKTAIEKEWFLISIPPWVAMWESME